MYVEIISNQSLIADTVTRWKVEESSIGCERTHKRYSKSKKLSHSL